MASITIIVAASLNDGKTNGIRGMTHIILFASFIMRSLIAIVTPLSRMEPQ